MKLVMRLFAASLPLMVMACGGMPAKKSADPAKAIEQRAIERWELLIAGKMADAYDYLSPGFRGIKSREAYATEMKNRPVRWTAARFNRVECPADAGFCDVTIDVDYEIHSTLPGVGRLGASGPVDERWVESGGQWYFVPKEVARQ